MTDDAKPQQARRPRFRRAADAPAFRVTEGDLKILQLLARHRFLRSTHIAALVDRSIDRVNDRLLRLFHAGYVDRPRAQLDHYPTAGSAPIAYALTDPGGRLIGERAKAEWQRKNRNAGRPFIDHQLEIMDFYVALQLAVRKHPGLSLIQPHELMASFPSNAPSRSNPFAFCVQLSYDGVVHDVALAPDLVFGLRFSDGSRRCFMVEVDRGTMPISRSDVRQTSIERKMRTYIAAHVAKQQEWLFGWKTFRVLIVANDRERIRSILRSCKAISALMNSGSRLFLFALCSELRASGPLAYSWCDGNGHDVQLI